MTLKLRELTEQSTGLTPGHGLCAGCAHPIAIRQILTALEHPPIVSLATGCVEVSTTRFPNSAWNVPTVHSAFENSATTVGGIEAAFKALKRKGRIPEDQKNTFVVLAGDGATYDIGLQWLSGALERDHRFIYICLNNEGYMNTGIQRSSATLLGAWTTTTPVGRAAPGKLEWRKDMTSIVAAHGIPYVAQAAAHNWKDLMTKVRKAEKADGPSFINVMSPCDRGWRFEPEDTIDVSQLATETGIWPLYEVVDGKWSMTGRRQHVKPVIDWLGKQGRFRHLMRPGNESRLEEIQARVDSEWHELQARCAIGSAK